MTQPATSDPGGVVTEFDVDAAFAEIIAAEWPQLEGRQTPASLCFTPGITDFGWRAAEFTRRASKLRAMPWQRWGLDHIMAKADDGTWTHPECCLIVPRQCGKSAILLMRVLYGIFKLDERVVFSAHQWETAKALWKRAWAIVKTTPWMLKHVVSHTCSQGRGVIELASGAVVVFTTRSAHAGRGLDRTDLVIYDEAYDLTEADMAALSPTKMAADDPQTIYTSSAVNAEQHTNGNVLAAVRRRGLRGEEGLFFAEWMAPDELDRADPETWRYANPAFGVIQTVKKMAAELVSMSTAAGRKSFDVEYLGRGDWPADEADRDIVVDPATWAQLLDREPALTGSRVLGLVMAPDRRHWAITAAQRTDTGRVHVELGRFAPTAHAEVVRFVEAVVTDWDPAAVVLDARGIGSVIVPKLRAAGIEPELLSTPQMAIASGSVLDAVDDGTLSHSGQSELTAAAEAVQKRTLPMGDFVLVPSQDAAPFVSAALAYAGVQLYAAADPPTPESVGFTPGASDPDLFADANHAVTAAPMNALAAAW